MAVMNINTSILEAASRIAQRAEVHPEKIKGRLLSIGIILIVGIVVSAITFAVIGAGLPETEPARLLTIFVLLGSLVLTLASFAAFFLVVWSAYVYQYVQAIEAKSETEEAAKQVQEVLQALVDIKQDDTFDLEVVRLVVSEINRFGNLSLAGNVVAELSRNRQFSQKLYNLIRARITRTPEIELLLDDAEEGEKHQSSSARMLHGAGPNLARIP